MFSFGQCIDSSLINSEVFCNLQYDPVCGCDGITYSSACEAEAHGVASYEAGVCQSNTFIFSVDTICALSQDSLGTMSAYLDNDTLFYSGLLMFNCCGHRSVMTVVENDTVSIIPELDTANMCRCECPSLVNVKIPLERGRDYVVQVRLSKSTEETVLVNYEPTQPYYEFQTFTCPLDSCPQEQILNAQIYNGRMYVKAYMNQNCCFDSLVEVYVTEDTIFLRQVPEYKELCRCYNMRYVEFDVPLTGNVINSVGTRKWVVLESSYSDTLISQAEYVNTSCFSCDDWHRLNITDFVEEIQHPYSFILDTTINSIIVRLEKIVQCYETATFQYRYADYNSIKIEASMHQNGFYVDEYGFITVCQAFSQVLVEDTIPYNPNLSSIHLSYSDWDTTFYIPKNGTIDIPDGCDVNENDNIPLGIKEVVLADGKLFAEITIPSDCCNYYDLSYNISSDTIYFGYSNTEMYCDCQCFRSFSFEIDELSLRSYWLIGLQETDTLVEVQSPLVMLDSLNMVKLCDSTTAQPEPADGETYYVENETFYFRSIYELNCCGDHSFAYSLQDSTVHVTLYVDDGMPCDCVCENLVEFTIPHFSFSSYSVTVSTQYLPTCPPLAINSLFLCEGDNLFIGDEVSIAVFNLWGQQVGSFPYSNLSKGEYVAEITQFCLDTQTESEKVMVNLHVQNCEVETTVLSLEINPSFAIGQLYETVHFTASIVYNDSTFIPASYPTILWEVEDLSFFEYTVAGETISVLPMNVGYTKIIAFIENHPEIADTVEFTSIDVQGIIDLDILHNDDTIENELEIYVGDTINLDIAWPLEVNTIADFHWNILDSSESISFIDDSAGILVALEEGDAILYAIHKFANFRTKQITVRVFNEKPEIEDVEISADGMKLFVHFNKGITSVENVLPEDFYLTLDSSYLKRLVSVSVESIEFAEANPSIIILHLSTPISDNAQFTLNCEGNILFTDGSRLVKGTTFVFESGTSISTDEFNVQLTPMPVDNMLNIRTGQQINSCVIYGINGIVLKASAAIDNSIDVSELVPGVYCIELFFENGNITHKFFVKK